MSSTPSARQSILQSLRQPLIQYLLMYLAVLCVFLPTLWYTFVWDDWQAIARNESLREWKNIPSFFTDPNTFSYDPGDIGLNAWRPLRNVYYLITYKIHGLRPAGWHFHHVLLHCLACAMLLALFHRLYRYAMNWSADRQLPAEVQAATWFAVLAWAVHPANTEVTAWLKSADDILASIMTIGSLMILFPSGKQLSYTRAVIAGVLFSFAFLAKESIAAVPMIYVALVLILSPDRKKALRYRPHWVAAFLLFAGLGGYMVLRKIMLGQLEQVPYMAGNFSLMMATMATAVVRYLQLTFWPFWPTVQIGDYLTWPLAKSWMEPSVIISLGILLATFTVTALIARKSRIFLVGWLFAALAFLPVANVIPMMQIMAERFMYFPLMGIALSLSILYVAWLRHGKFSQRILLPIAIAVALGVTTEVRLPIWIDEGTFQKTLVRLSPENPRAQYNWASQQYLDGHTSAALTTFLEMQSHQPTNTNLADAVTQALNRLDSETTGPSHLDTLLKKYPDSLSLLIMKADRYRLREDYLNATRYYNKALPFGQRNPYLWYFRAVCDHEVGNNAAATRALKHSLELKPDLTSATLLMKTITDTSSEGQ